MNRFVQLLASLLLLVCCAVDAERSSTVRKDDSQPEGLPLRLRFLLEGAPTGSYAPRALVKASGGYARAVSGVYTSSPGAYGYGYLTAEKKSGKKGKKSKKSKKSEKSEKSEKSGKGKKSKKSKKSNKSKKSKKSNKD